MLAELRIKVPFPALTKALPEALAVLTTAPEIVAVTAALSTLMVRVDEPKVTVPVSFRLFTSFVPPKLKSPLTVTGLDKTRTGELLRIEVLLPMIKLPKPTGPAVMVEPLSVALAPSKRLPPAKVKLEEKVLVPLKAKRPSPVLVSDVIEACCVMVALICKPVGASPAFTKILGLALLNCRTAKVAEPAEITGVVPKLLLVAVIGVAELRTKVAVLTVGVPRLTVGVAEPPSLLKVKLARVCVGPVL